MRCQWSINPWRDASQSWQSMMTLIQQTLASATSQVCAAIARSWSSVSFLWRPRRHTTWIHLFTRQLAQAERQLVKVHPEQLQITIQTTSLPYSTKLKSSIKEMEQISHTEASNSLELTSQENLISALLSIKFLRICQATFKSFEADIKCRNKEIPLDSINLPV